MAMNHDQTPLSGPVIQARGLRRVFKSRRQSVEAVAGVDLQVEHGEIFGFLGPNGAGKTTTVECAQGLRRPDGGLVRVLGHDERG